MGHCGLIGKLSEETDSQESLHSDILSALWNFTVDFTDLITKMYADFSDE